jgi:hypothetical protein
LSILLSRTEKISGFHLKVSRHERELYEEFCNSAEAELLREMRDYFIEAKQKPGVINFDRLGVWSKIQKRIDLWLREANRCHWRGIPSLVSKDRSYEAPAICCFSTWPTRIDAPPHPLHDLEQVVAGFR